MRIARYRDAPGQRDVSPEPRQQALVAIASGSTAALALALSRRDALAVPLVAR
jgi:hypothetical protein